MSKNKKPKEEVKAFVNKGRTKSKTTDKRVKDNLDIRSKKL